MKELSTKVAGIDTGKANLDVALFESQTAFRVANEAGGWQALIEQLVAAGIERVGIEASGGYEAGVVGAVRAAGLRIDLFQPMQVKLFARSQLKRAKTDKLDAALIAEFTAWYRPERLPADIRMASLANHLTHIEQFEEDIARYKVRLEHQHEPRFREQIEADIANLKARCAAARRSLEAELRQHQDLARRLDLLLSIQGIGRRTALPLLIRMPELGQLSREQVAALAGLAPFNHDSGQMKGSRHIAGGRSRVRTALYAAAMPAAYHWNPALISFYKRLIAKGKSHKLALTACARKLLIYANTVIARDQPWIPQS